MIGGGIHILLLLSNDSSPLWSLRQVASVCHSCIFLRELGMRCSDLALMPPSLAWSARCTRVLSHSRICNVASFLGILLYVILYTGNASIGRWFDDIVVFDGSEIEQGLFLNGLAARLLLLWLRLEIGSAIRRDLNGMLLTIARLPIAAIAGSLIVLLLDICSCLVLRHIILH